MNWRKNPGDLVPVREWTCPVHDAPQYDDHYCDCDHCAYEPAPPCPTCETAEWVDKVGPDGNVVMREIGPWEAMLRNLGNPIFPRALIAEAIAARGKTEWLEDEIIPRVASDRTADAA